MMMATSPVNPRPSDLDRTARITWKIVVVATVHILFTTVCNCLCIFAMRTRETYLEHQNKSSFVDFFLKKTVNKLEATWNVPIFFCLFTVIKKFYIPLVRILPINLQSLYLIHPTSYSDNSTTKNT
jgi:hypothetical protein